MEKQKESQVFAAPENVKILKALSLLAVGASLLPSANAAETCEKRETRGEIENGSWADQG